MPWKLPELLSTAWMTVAAFSEHMQNSSHPTQSTTMMVVCLMIHERNCEFHAVETTVAAPVALGDVPLQ